MCVCVCVCVYLFLNRVCLSVFVKMTTHLTTVYRDPCVTTLWQGEFNIRWQHLTLNFIKYIALLCKEDLQSCAYVGCRFMAPLRTEQIYMPHMNLLSSTMWPELLYRAKDDGKNNAARFRKLH